MMPFLTSGSGSCHLVAIEVDVGDDSVTLNGGPSGTVYRILSVITMT